MSTLFSSLAEPVLPIQPKHSLSHSLFDSASRIAHKASPVLRSLGLKDSVLSEFKEFLLTEVDPLMGRKRIAAEVFSVLQETQEAKTFYLQPAHGWKGFVAGQSINVEVEVDGVRYRRNYSISCSPAEFETSGLISITVKVVEGGRVSEYLHRHLEAGAVVYISQAHGAFVLPEQATEADAGYLFMAAGSGITPIMAMLDALSESTDLSACQLIYYVCNEAEIIFNRRLLELSARFPELKYKVVCTDREGRISARQLKAHCPDARSRQIYLCGPEGFMTAAESYLVSLDVESGQIHKESFSPALISINADEAKSGYVTFAKSGKTVFSDGTKSLLELAEEAGLNPKFGCRNGICHECSCSKTQGVVSNLQSGAVIGDDQTMIQACVSVPKGDLAIGSW